ncbi:hypothetical protein [Methylobacterium ajmalii]|uniref:hypothetical protein n=1 Tax=Methylobacterium ajmalii TaxID=2738439 RepID=UPI002F34FB28
MSAKPTAPGFGPAPTPRKRPGPQVMADIQASTAPLGQFQRSTAQPQPAEPAPIAPPHLDPEPIPPQPEPQPQPTAAPAPQVDEKRWTVKFEVTQAAYEAMLTMCARRGITMKRFCLEMAKREGLPIDLDAEPEDGRKIRGSRKR